PASILRGPVCGFAVLVSRCGCGDVGEEPFAEYVVGESREALVGCCLECCVAGGVEGCGHGGPLVGSHGVSPGRVRRRAGPRSRATAGRPSPWRGGGRGCRLRFPPPRRSGGR